MRQNAVKTELIRHGSAEMLTVGRGKAPWASWKFRPGLSFDQTSPSWIQHLLKSSSMGPLLLSEAPHFSSDPEVSAPSSQGNLHGACELPNSPEAGTIDSQRPCFSSGGHQLPGHFYKRCPAPLHVGLCHSAPFT